MLATTLCLIFGSKGAFAQGASNWVRMNINNMGYWVRWDGLIRYSTNGTQHMIYPEGTSTSWAADGVLWGGYCYTDAAKTQKAPGQFYRMSGQFRGNIAFRAGRIIGSGATAVASDPAAADTRAYRIRRDYARLSESELKVEAAQLGQIGLTAVTNAQMAAVTAQYQKDWNEWPVQYGAPYIDRNKNGVYDKPPAFSSIFTVDSLIGGNFDEPGVAGADPNSPADQVVWLVNNDLNPSSNLFGSENMGMETQYTIWGYKRTGALGQVIFRRMKIINKGGVVVSGTQKGAFTVDSCFIGLDGDPDLGDFTEDLIGCDTTASLAFIYDAFPKDRQYSAFGIVPPAIGADFLQGPRVPSLGDSAVFNLRRVYGYKNLPMTSFAYFSSGGAISDPPAGTYEGALRYWKLLRGYVPDPSTAADRLYPFPPGFTANKYPLSGDPVAKTGFIDGLGTQYSFAPGDRRIVLASGPFTLAPGDTQELVLAYVGGLGADRLSSVAVMKFNDRFVQNTYDALFQVPNAPAAPSVKAAELDGKIVIEWGSDLSRVSNTENTIVSPGAYKFEGYNVYQFPSRSAALKDAKRIATYDVPTDPTIVLDEQFDLPSGQVLKVPVQFGTNGGIKRVFEFKKDYVLDIDKVYNGQEYYLAVTAYSVSSTPGFVPSSLESAPAIITVRPRIPFGKTFSTVYGDTLKVTHTGTSEGVVRPLVIDPTLNTGNTYEVQFEGPGTATTWKLVNKTKGITALSGQVNQAGDDVYPIVDGMLLKVEGPLFQGKSFTLTPSADRWYAGAGTGELANAAVYLAPKYTGSTVAPADYKTAEIRFIAKTGYTDLTGNTAYDVGEPYLLPATGTQKAFFYTGYTNTTYEGFFNVPFTAWDVSNAASPRQLNVVVVDPDQNKQWDLHSQVTNAALPNNGDLRNNIVWITASTYDPNGVKYNPTGGTGWMGSTNGVNESYWVVWMSPRAGFEPYGRPLTLRLVPNLINSTADAFSFTAPAASAGASVEKTSTDRIGVFPNPYYAFNPAETSRFQRFITFNNLPQKTTIRIFNLGGEIVAVLRKDDSSQFMQWNLLNRQGLPAASGFYIAHVEATLPSDGSVVNKILKFSIVQEKEILDVY